MQILHFALGVTQILHFALAQRYQHVGIPNEKFWRWGHNRTPTLDAKYFASQWNIGLRYFMNFASLITEIFQFKNICQNIQIIFVWFILLFYFPHLHNLYHDIALFFGYQLHICLVGIFKPERKNRSQYGCRRIDRYWLNCITSTEPFSLTGNRGKYFRVIGIHRDG